MKGHLFHRFSLGLLVLLAAITTPAIAAEPSKEQAAESQSPLVRYFMQDYMLGDWGGLRTDLASHGVDMEFFYVGSMPTNLTGGIRTGTVYQHGMLFALDLDTEKLLGLKGGHFHASAAWLEGRPFSANYVGDLNKTNLVDFPADFRLWQIWYEQQLWDNKFSIKLGLLSVDRDFILPELYNSLASINFLNQTFFYPTLAFNLYDIPAFGVGNHALPSTPYAAPGIRLKWNVTDSIYLQAAAYGGNPDTSSSGTRLGWRPEEGILTYYELGYRHNQRKGDQGLPGNYKLGAYYHSDEFLNMYNAVGNLGFTPFGYTNGESDTFNGNWGAYFLAEQMLWREKTWEDPAQQGIVGFFRLTKAPGDRNLTEFGVDGGLVFRGLIPTRDYDTLGIAASYLRISSDLRRGMRDANEILPGTFFIEDYEGVIELNYKFQLAAWWTLQPSLQYVVNPGGVTTNHIPNAWVFSLQTTLRF